MALREVVAAGLPAVVVNPSGILGPVDPGPSRMGSVLLAAARGRMPVSIAGGFDWVDVRDVVAALVAAAERGRPGESYLIGGHDASMTDLLTLAAAAAGRPRPALEIPTWLARAIAPAVTTATGLVHADASPLLTADALHALASRPVIDHTKATAALGHRPRPLADTVADLVAWFAVTGALPGRGVHQREEAGEESFA